MTSSDSRVRLLAGVLLLLVGAGLVAFSHRVLATFFLDVVVQSLQSETGEALEPYDFPWGTMHWGRSAVDFTIMCAGIVLLALGQILVAPPVIRQIRSATPGNSSMFPRLAMVGSAVVMLLAAGTFLLIPSMTKSALGTMAVVGAADPVSLAGDLPILASRMFMVCLVLSQVLVALAAFAVPPPGLGVVPRHGAVLAYGAGGFLSLFAILISAIRFGPVQTLSGLVDEGDRANPVELAVEISKTINLMFAAGPLLAAAAILTGLAVLMPPKACA